MVSCRVNPPTDRGGPATAPPSLMPQRSLLLRSGRVAWSLLGVAGVIVLLVFALSRVAVVVVPLLLALFPAAALSPAVGWLVRHRVPRVLAALLVVLAVLGGIAGLVAALVPQFVGQLPALADSVTRSVRQLQPLLERAPGVPEGTSLTELAEQATSWLTGGDAVGGAVGLTLGALEFLAGAALVLVALFFYLYDGGRIGGLAIGVLPPSRRATATELGGRLWSTLGRFFRAQFVVAVFDAVLIGTGLALIGVPLALPLAVLVFLGGFFPYVGATASGLLAVLVAFADGGTGIALGTLALVLGVQQLEGNVIEPLVAGRMVRLSAFTVIVAIAAGATVLGVLGAFLAVPVAACTARVLGFVRERREAGEVGRAVS